MSATPHTLFAAYDCGRLSRRQLLQALGLAVAPVALSTLVPPASFAQGQCGGARKGTPECDPTPAKLPFASTGWKTVLLDHLSCQVADYAKEAAFYTALMNWPVRSDDGKQAMLDIGDWGGLQIRGGYTAPPAQPAAAADPSAPARAPRAPRLAAFDSICWGIAPWDTKKVEAELKARGLNPVADHKGDVQSFHVKDPDGFGLQISNGNRGNRRQGAAAAKFSAPAPFANTNWRTVWLDHISFEASNYKETAAFYHALLGWKLGDDEGSQNSCDIGDIGGIIIRRGNRGRGHGHTAAAARVDWPHLVRHHAVRSGYGESGTREARAERARGYRRPRRHSYRAVQELPHDDAKWLRPADQRDDAGRPAD